MWANHLRAGGGEAKHQYSIQMEFLDIPNIHGNFFFVPGKREI